MVKLEIYADGCDLEKTKELYNNKIVTGFTTNPTLMKKAGVTDYKQFIEDFVEIVPDMPISFMVLNELNIVSESIEISDLAENSYIKIPIVNTKGISNMRLIKCLSNIGIKINITSVFTIEQIKEISQCHFKNNINNIIVSIFAGRIANTRINPEYIINFAKHILSKNIKVLWASSREIFNILQAEKCNCDIITLDYQLLDKLNLIDKDLDEYCIETVKMFYNDAEGYVI